MWLSYVCTEKNEWHLERGCESLCPLQGYNLALVRAAIHWVFGSGTGLWEDVCNRLGQFRYCFVVFDAAGVALRYRPVGLSESTRSSRHFKYSLELYLALWYWANASRSIRYAIESGCYDSIDLGGSLTSWRSMNLTEIVFWIIHFDSWRCFVHLRCLWSLLITSCEYARYSGIVRTMPTYLLWPLSIWSGDLLCDLYICGL